MRRIVVKIGTQVIVSQSHGVDRAVLSQVATTLASFKAAKLDIVLVTSGAVGLGRVTLGLKPPLTTAEKQACAAIGQGQLMKLYKDSLGEHGIVCGQILVTSQDLSQRVAFNHLRDTFETLLKFNAIPIVNENDSVSTAELQETGQASFGDNDKLSAIVSTKIAADLLVLITNVDGVYTKNPKKDPSAQRLKIVEDVAELNKVDASGGSEMGRGGMTTKLEAARMAAICGVPVLITSLEEFQKLAALDKNAPLEAFAHHGTLILPDKKLKGKKKWIGTSSGFKASVTINEGAKKALYERNASLLSIGVVTVQGEFQSGDIISVRDEMGSEVARGVSKLDSQNIESTKSGVLIHRDELALLLEYEGERS